MVKEPESSKYTLNAVEQDCFAASDTSAMVKLAFRSWIYEGRSKQHDPDSIIASFDKASEQLLHRRLSYMSLWEITNPSIFSNIYKKAMNDKLFRVTDRKTYFAFIKIGEIVSKVSEVKACLYINQLSSLPILLKSLIML